MALQKALSKQQRTEETWYPPGKVALASAVSNSQPEQRGTPVKLCQNAVIIVTAWTSDNDQSLHLPLLLGGSLTEVGREAYT